MEIFHKIYSDKNITAKKKKKKSSVAVLVSLAKPKTGGLIQVIY